MRSPCLGSWVPALGFSLEDIIIHQGQGPEAQRPFPCPIWDCLQVQIWEVASSRDQPPQTTSSRWAIHTYRQEGPWTQHMHRCTPWPKLPFTRCTDHAHPWEIAYEIPYITCRLPVHLEADRKEMSWEISEREREKAGATQATHTIHVAALFCL